MVASVVVMEINAQALIALIIKKGGALQLP